MTKSVQALFRPAPASQRHGSEDTDGEDDTDHHLRADGAGPSMPSSPGIGKGDDGGRRDHKHDPEEYQHAKKQLKKAMLECYR